MKDITIKGKIIKQELMFLLISFAIGLLLNIYSIMKYHTEWKEIFTTIHVTLLFGLVIYAVIGLIRLIIKGIAAVFSLAKKSN